MPHVIVKLFPGRSEEQKEQMTKEIANTILSVTGCKEKSISIAFEEVEKENWVEEVYKPHIQNKDNILYKKPGYNPFE